MILHTVIPLEKIMEKIKYPGKKLTTMNINGVILEGEKNGDYFKIHRVISSDPNAYMNRNISPGMYIKNTNRADPL